MNTYFRIQAGKLLVSCIAFYATTLHAQPMFKCLSSYSSNSQSLTQSIFKNLEKFPPSLIKKLEDPYLDDQDPAVLEFDTFIRRRVINSISALYPEIDLSQLNNPWSPHAQIRFDSFLREIGNYEEFIKIFDFLIEHSDRKDRPLQPENLLKAVSLATAFKELPKKPIPFPIKKNIVDSKNLEILLKLSEGSMSEAYLVLHQGKKMVFLKPKLFITNPKVHQSLASLGTLTPEEQQGLLRTGVQFKTEIKEDDDFDLRWLGMSNGSSKNPEQLDRLKQFRKVAIATSEIIIRYEDLVQLGKLKFNYTPISPSPYGLVRKDTGAIEGYLMDYLPFPTLKQILADKKISISQFHQLATDLRAQLNFLHNQNISHGDLNTGNILVETGPAEFARAHLIDFSSPLNSYNQSHRIYLEKNQIELLLKQLRQEYFQ